MVLYPILSVLPQEFLFRSFFFRRYQPLFSTPWAIIIASAACFAYVHIVFHNWVAPSFCLIGGLIFAHSYSHHRSLKWVLVEHAAYGCMVFTIGLRFYFLFAGYRLSCLLQKPLLSWFSFL
jgi:membrane protease YdiL (CAAX protease family)